MGKKSRLKKERRWRKEHLSTNPYFVAQTYHYFLHHENIDLESLTQEEMNELFDQYHVHHNRDYTEFSFKRVGVDSIDEGNRESD